MSDELADLLDALEVFIRRYVVVDEAQATALVLWAVHTWAIAAAHATPYLYFTSAEPESGKTRLLEVLHELVRAPLLTMNISDAALFRAIDARNPTLFFDEVDAVFSKKAQERGVREDLRAILNAGYRRGQVVYRMGGGNRTTLEDFAVFGAKALAGLGSLPPTLASRCIRIELKRRRLTEPVEDFYPQDVADETERLRAQLESWTATMIDVLQMARPVRVEGIRDRTMEVWRPLLAIAELDGESWATRARRAVLTLSTGSVEEPSLGLLLLADIRDVFEETDALRLATADLILDLARREESPWGEWWVDPKTATPKQGAPRALARLLRPHGIRSAKVRIGERTAQGYKLEDFVDAWERFLPPRPGGTSGTSGTSAPLSQADVPHVPDVPHTREADEPMDGSPVTANGARSRTEPPAFPR